jgi:hypothetical protein
MPGCHAHLRPPERVPLVSPHISDVNRHKAPPKQQRPPVRRRQQPKRSRGSDRLQHATQEGPAAALHDNGDLSGQVRHSAAVPEQVVRVLKASPSSWTVAAGGIARTRQTKLAKAARKLLQESRRLHLVKRKARYSCMSRAIVRCYCSCYCWSDRDGLVAAQCQKAHVEPVMAAACHTAASCHLIVPSYKQGYKVTSTTRKAIHAALYSLMSRILRCARATRCCAHANQSLQNTDDSCPDGKQVGILSKNGARCNQRATKCP